MDLGDVMSRLADNLGGHEGEQSLATPFPLPIPNDDLELFPPARWQALGATLRLTPRQVEIARQICRGGTYKSIATQSGISINTVRMHMRALFAKLGAHDRVTAVIQIVMTERTLPVRARQAQPGG